MVKPMREAFDSGAKVVVKQPWPLQLTLKAKSLTNKTIITVMDHRDWWT